MEESSGLGYDNKSVRFIFTLFLPGLLTDNMLVWAAPVWAEAKQDNKWKKKKKQSTRTKKTFIPNPQFDQTHTERQHI